MSEEKKQKNRFAEFLKDNLKSTAASIGTGLPAYAIGNAYNKNLESKGPSDASFLEKFKIKYPEAFEKAGNPNINLGSHPRMSGGAYESLSKTVHMPYKDDALLLHELGHAQIAKEGGLFGALQELGIPSIAKAREAPETLSALDKFKLITRAVGAPTYAPLYEGKAWANAITNANKGEKLGMAAKALVPYSTYGLGALGSAGALYYGVKSIKDLISPGDE